jgi:hypothetical protein
LEALLAHDPVLAPLDVRVLAVIADMTKDLAALPGPTEIYTIVIFVMEAVLSIMSTSHVVTFPHAAFTYLAYMLPDVRVHTLPVAQSMGLSTLQRHCEVLTAALLHQYSERLDLAVLEAIKLLRFHLIAQLYCKNSGCATVPAASIIKKGNPLRRCFRLLRWLTHVQFVRLDACDVTLLSHGLCRTLPSDPAMSAAYMSAATNLQVLLATDCSPSPSQLESLQRFFTLVCDGALTLHLHRYIILVDSTLSSTSYSTKHEAIAAATAVGIPALVVYVGPELHSLTETTASSWFFTSVTMES